LLVIASFQICASQQCSPSVFLLSIPVPLVDFFPLNFQFVRKALTSVKCPVRIFEKFLLEEAKLVEIEAVVNFLFLRALPLFHD